MIKNIAWAVLCMLFTIALPGCGGESSDGSTPDAMTVTISDQSGTVTTTYTEGSYSTNSAGHSFLNPLLNSYITASNETNMELLYWDGVSLGTTVIINMRVNSNTPGSYSTGILNPANCISYQTNNQPYISLFSSVSGTITLKSIGNVGEKITGSFDSVVSLLTNTSDTRQISAAFSVTRDN